MSSGRVLNKRTKEIMVYQKGGVPYKTALVDQDRFTDLSRFKWLFDFKTNTAYRNMDFQTEGKATREYLARRVLGCKTGDGQVVRFKTDDKLDCRSTNISIDPVLRHVTKWNTDSALTGKVFPSRAVSFLNYMEKNHPNSLYTNFLSAVSIQEYSKKKIVFVIEDDSNEISPLSMGNKMQDFFKEEFGYLGTVSVIRQVRKAVIDEAAPKVVPIPAAASSTIATSSPRSEALDFLKRLNGVFGAGNKDTALEFCNFGIRQQDEILEFSFSRKKAPPTSPQSPDIPG